VAAGAEIARLAGEGEQDIVPTGIAVDAREAVVRIAAFEKAVDDLVFHRAVQARCTAQLTGVPDHAPVERARARVVRAICAPWCATAQTSSVSFAARHSSSNAQQGVPTAWSLLAMKKAQPPRSVAARLFAPSAAPKS